MPKILVVGSPFAGMRKKSGVLGNGVGKIRKLLLAERPPIIKNSSISRSSERI